MKNDIKKRSHKITLNFETRKKENINNTLNNTIN